jgi:sulfopyruvate decarboxylase TPP-binding subunit
VLDALGIPSILISKETDLEKLEASIRSAYADSRVRAAFLQPELWPCSA